MPTTPPPDPPRRGPGRPRKSLDSSPRRPRFVSPAGALDPSPNLSIRLDERTAIAVRRLQASGASVSAVVRDAIQRAAAFLPEEKKEGPSL